MTPTLDQLLHTLTRVCNTLIDNDIPFAVAGGCAAYARGGPASDHDVDIFVKQADVARASSALIAAGMRAAHPPEDWLSKVYDGDMLVDLIFRPNFRAVTDATFERASWMRIGPTAALVISGTDLMIDKLMVLDSHRLDFGALLEIARDLREQVDWDDVRAATAASPYARAFVGLLDDLAITQAGRVDPMQSDQVLPQYLVAHIRRAFAEDPRTAELGVRVTVRGDVVYLSGEVSSAECKQQLEAIVHEQLPSVRLQNDVHVVDCREPVETEQLQ
ncbi:MAG: nucleotidyltransferase family protein [Aldersonia sp.]|nr:nucleotidyltransferase family protein [Aldersonia sp.]